MKSGSVCAGKRPPVAVRWKYERSASNPAFRPGFLYTIAGAIVGITFAPDGCGNVIPRYFVMPDLPIVACIASLPSVRIHSGLMKSISASRYDLHSFKSFLPGCNSHVRHFTAPVNARSSTLNPARSRYVWSSFRDRGPRGFFDTTNTLARELPSAVTHTSSPSASVCILHAVHAALRTASSMRLLRVTVAAIYLITHSRTSCMTHCTFASFSRSTPEGSRNG